MNVLVDLLDGLMADLLDVAMAVVLVDLLDGLMADLLDVAMAVVLVDLLGVGMGMRFQVVMMGRLNN